MKIIACVVIGIVCGLACGGWAALRKARQSEFAAATRHVRWSMLATTFAAALSTWLFFGWPWMSDTEIVSEKITITVIEQVEEVIPRAWWNIFGKDRVEMKDVPHDQTETVDRKISIKVFSFWLLCLTVLLGILVAVVDWFVLRLLWLLWPANWSNV